MCFGRRTLATAESENEVAYFLHTLNNQGVIFDTAGYDDCCHLVPMLRLLSLLNDREFFIPHFHHFSSKCTKYKADLIFDVSGVNTGAAEQRFKLLRQMAGVVMNMNELNWNFHVDMVLLTLNEFWLHAGVARELHCRYVEPSAVEKDLRKPERGGAKRKKKRGRGAVQQDAKAQGARGWKTRKARDNGGATRGRRGKETKKPNNNHKRGNPSPRGPNKQRANQERPQER